jgi:type II secretion system protein N
MRIFRNILILLAAIPVFIVLVWFFAVPTDLVRERIEGSITNAGQGNINASLKGFKKGLFLTVRADSLDLDLDRAPALTITNIAGCFKAAYLIKRQIAFSVKGKIGTGDINSLLTYPADGEIRIEKADLNEIPYLTHLGIKTNGHISADILLGNKSARITFQVPDMDLQESTINIPFINSFHRVHGALSVSGNDIKLESVSLEGDKGYARLRGDIRNNIMDLRLELMPAMEKLSSIELMLIGKYIVSPGYYVLPIKGPVDYRQTTIR